MNLFAWFRKKPVPQQLVNQDRKDDSSIPPGRVSVPNELSFNNLISVMGVKDLVLPSF